MTNSCTVPIKSHLSLIAALLALIFPILSLAEDAQPDEARRIELVKNRLLEERQKLDSLTEVKQTELQQLNSIDEQLELTSELVTRLDRKLRRLTGRESELKSESAATDSLLDRQKTRLSVSLRNFYLRRRRTTDIMLTSSGISQAVSQIVYTRTSVESLESLISSTDSLLSSLDEKTRMLKETRAEIDRSYRESSREKNLLQSERKRRDNLMDKIRGEENLFREHLRQLESDALAADSLFAAEGVQTSKSLFETQKGKLPYPLKGEIIKNFGKQQDRDTWTETFCPGIEIKGELDSEIRAVYDGSVFHRGELRGYGRVLILDHGEGWYTLYAHLSDYSVSMGQSVKTGDVIGHLGTSRVKGGPSLHFQIRFKREQYDPVEWLKL